MVQDIGGLIGDALIALLAGRARDLLGLLPDLVADPPGIGEQRRGVGAGGPRGGARRDRPLERRQRLVGRARVELAAVKAAALAGVAGRAGRLDQRQQRVGVSVVPDRLDRERVARGRALAPQLLSGTAEEVNLSGLAREA